MCKKCIFSPLKMKAEPNCHPNFDMRWQILIVCWFVSDAWGEQFCISSCVKEGRNISMGWALCTTKWVKSTILREHNTTTQPQHTTTNMSRCRPTLQRLQPSLSMGRPAAPLNHGAAAPQHHAQAASHRACVRRSWFPCLGRRNATHQKTEREVGPWPWVAADRSI